MIGTFRQHTPTDPGFFEIMTLGQVGQRTLLRVKHFSGDFTPWEEKEEWTDFRFIEAEPDQLFFHGLTLAAEGDDGLVIYIAMRDGDGASREEVLRYRRVR